TPTTTNVRTIPSRLMWLSPCVFSIGRTSGLSRSATDSRNDMRLDLLVAKPGQQLPEGRRPDDRIELTPVVRNKADAVEHHVVHLPSIAPVDETVVDRDLHSAVGRDPGPHLFVRGVDRCAQD